MQSSPDVLAIGERLRTQNNRCTDAPMFCVQIRVRDVGYDAAFCEGQCWHDGPNQETIYDDDPGFKEPTSYEAAEYDLFGYHDRWETVMVAFTEKGCEEYLELNGHNDRRRAFRGEVRVYAESFNRCPEMLAVREALMAMTPEPTPPPKNALDRSKPPKDYKVTVYTPEPGWSDCRVWRDGKMILSTSGTMFDLAAQARACGVARAWDIHEGKKEWS